MVAKQEFLILKSAILRSSGVTEAAVAAPDWEPDRHFTAGREEYPN
jgi:hypothetical protein